MPNFNILPQSAYDTKEHLNPLTPFPAGVLEKRMKALASLKDDKTELELSISREFPRLYSPAEDTPKAHEEYQEALKEAYDAVEAHIKDLSLPIYIARVPTTGLPKAGMNVWMEDGGIHTRFISNEDKTATMFSFKRQHGSITWGVVEEVNSGYKNFGWENTDEYVLSRQEPIFAVMALRNVHRAMMALPNNALWA